MSEELKKHHISCVSIYPGYIDNNKKAPNPKIESSQLVRRAIAALAFDKKKFNKTVVINFNI